MPAGASRHSDGQPVEWGGEWHYESGGGGGLGLGMAQEASAVSCPHPEPFPLTHVRSVCTSDVTDAAPSSPIDTLRLCLV